MYVRREVATAKNEALPRAIAPGSALRRNIEQLRRGPAVFGEAYFSGTA
jgi:hypothetical protein